MNRDFWAGIVISGFLSLVLGVVGALITPPIATWYKGWGKTRDAAREDRERKQYGEIMTYLRYPQKFTQFLLRNAITLLVGIGLWLLGSFLTLMTALARIVLQVRNLPMSYAQSLAIEAMIYGGLMVTAMAYWIELTAYLKIEKIWSVVNSLERFLVTMPEKIRNRALEDEVLRTNPPIEDSFG